MFVKFEEDKQKVPIKIWLGDETQIEEGALNQLRNLSNLPFVFKHIVACPDVHFGMGMPIGGVVATDGVIIPNAVGSDVGCGVAYSQTNISIETLGKDDQLIKNIVGNIMRNVPCGFGHHREKQQCSSLDHALGGKYENLNFAKELLSEIECGYYQVSTLGGGNHFIELQQDVETQQLAIMLHSGSRNFGFKICKFFNDIARRLNRQWYSSVPEDYKMAFLPVDSIEGKSYIDWMNLALEFAHENREKMMIQAKNVIFNMAKKYVDVSRIEILQEVNCHHNYAVIENHFGQNVWVHRKGAIRAREGDIGLIPGSMGSFSFVAAGLGNPESFNSASHGAGRRFSRTAAKKQFTVQSVMEELKRDGVVLGKQNKEDVAEECKGAYKDVELVILQESDLIKPLKKLKTIAVIKG